MKCKCKQCGKEFEITQSEINFYKSKNFQLPKRCKECRENNKEKEHKLNANNSNNNNSSVPEATKQKSKLGQYLIAAVIVIVAIVCSLVFKIDLFKTDNQSNPTSNEISSQNFQTNKKNYGYEFKNNELLSEHYEKHGKAMGFASKEEYEKAAAQIVHNSKAMHKTEAEDGDDVFYLKDTNDFVIVSKKGYIRTYFNPEDGIAYFNRQ